MASLSGGKFFSVARLARRRNDGQSGEQIHSVKNILDCIRKDIKACANNIDCYYKEHRLGASFRL